MSNPVSSVGTFKESPSQTAGPYAHIGFLPSHAGLNLRTQERLNILTGEGVEGEPIRIEGAVYDGAGALVRDAVIESWQADAQGRHNQSGFFGWGRAAADDRVAVGPSEPLLRAQPPMRHALSAR